MGGRGRWLRNRREIVGGEGLADWMHIFVGRNADARGVVLDGRGVLARLIRLGQLTSVCA